jgi:RNA polymerase sigma factor (sigma-70 family)
MQFKDIDFQSAFTNLTSQEKHILELRFGLNGNKQVSLYQIGQQLNLTRERIRQIEAKALRKLRRPDSVRALLKISDLEIEEE